MASGWISKKARNAIYQRDNMVCAYCGKVCQPASLPGMTKAEQAAHMRANKNDIVTLDHIVSQRELALATRNDAEFAAAQRDPKNLVTACNGCNSSKRHTELYVWCNIKNINYSAVLIEIGIRTSKAI